MLNERLREENEALREELKKHRKDVEVLEEKEKVLLRKVNMNSSNSSKPPSTDGFRRPPPRSLRVKSDMKQGGQPGHKGRNIVLPHDPDEFVDHYPERCSGCRNFEMCKSKSAFRCAERRFVVDMVMTAKVTEHRTMEADSTDAPCYGGSSERSPRGTFPEDVRGYIQYGDSITSLVAILSGYGFMSYGRITGLIRDMLGITISAGTAVSMVSRCADRVAPGIESIRERLLTSKIVNTDETGVHINGKCGWVHSTSNSRYLYQTVNEKRGKDGINGHGIIPDFKGVAIHDCFSPYFSYDSDHGLCCAHLLRELKGIEQLKPDHEWSGLFSNFLVSLDRAKKTTVCNGNTGFDDDRIQRISLRYDGIMALADSECPPTDNRGRKRKGPERSLIDRLQRYKGYILHFITDFDVPFDNNQAERDVRYAKIKMKVSGQFRDIGHAQEFLDIISYIGTARKNGVSAYNALTSAFAGNTDIIFG